MSCCRRGFVPHHQHGGGHQVQVAHSAVLLASNVGRGLRVLFIGCVSPVGCRRVSARVCIYLGLLGAARGPLFIRLFGNPLPLACGGGVCRPYCSIACLAATQGCKMAPVLLQLSLLLHSSTVCARTLGRPTPSFVMVRRPTTSKCSPELSVCTAPTRQLRRRHHLHTGSTSPIPIPSKRQPCSSCW